MNMQHHQQVSTGWNGCNGKIMDYKEDEKYER